MNKRNIWIIDDEPEIADLQASNLEDAFACRTFSSAREALVAYESAPEGVDLIVSDIRMPELDGVAFSTQIKLLRKDQPIVLMSGCTEKEDLLRALELGIAGFLEKPFNAHKFRTLVEYVLSNHEKLIASRNLVSALLEQARIQSQLTSLGTDRYITAENAAYEAGLPVFENDRGKVLRLISEESRLHRALAELKTKVDRLVASGADPLIAVDGFKQPRIRRISGE